MITKEKKQEYMKDFNEKVLTCTDKYWAIDAGLKEILIKINSNPNVQTLFSRRYFKGKKWDLHFKHTSYLAYTIVDGVNLEKILELPQYLSNKFGQKFRCISSEGESFFSNSSGKIQMGCLDNSEYFNVAHNMLLFKSKLESEHDIFWKEVELYLTSV